MAVGVLVVAVGVASCDESIRTVAGPSPELLPTIASIQKEVFQTTDAAGRNACISCHTNVGRTPPENLNLAGDAHAALVNVPSRQRPQLMLIKPGDPENSYLIHKIEGRAGIAGTRMPRTGPPFLTPGQILIIKRWIENGAPR